MNKTIKIALISLVVVSIAAVIIYFVNVTELPKSQEIASTPFEKEIASQVAKDIEGHDYTAATSAFNDILGVISTEASIVNSDGKKLLSETEVENCKKIAFYAYEPIFDSYQNSYFARSSWTDKELSALKTRAQKLLSMNIAEEEAKRSLSKVVSNVNDYYAAWAVVKRAHSCSSVSAVNKIKSDAASFKRAPLTNNASLSAGLNGAFSDAKNSLANSIKAKCHSVARNYQSYSSYESFYAAEEAALERINEYINAFGGATLFSESKSELKNADVEAMSYYRNSNRNNGISNYNREYD